MNKVKKAAEAVKAYKVFNEDLACRGFQYEIGKTYETEGDTIEKGFYAWESPVAMFCGDYMFGARFCEVELSGNISRGDFGHKTYASKIKIVAELKLVDIIRLGIKWLTDTTPQILIGGGVKSVNNNDYCANIVLDDIFPKVESTDVGAKISPSNDWVRVVSSGDFAKIVSSNDYVRIVSKGSTAKIGSSGDSTQIGSSGYSANINTSGFCARIGSSGKCANIISSGDSVRIVSSGDLATIACTRANACIGSNGHHALISTSGDFAKISSNGNFANINSNGFGTRVESSGNNSVIYCTGPGGRVKAKKGSWITLAEWIFDTDEPHDLLPVCIKTEYVDGDRIKEDTWYRIENGEFVECKS